ncbi:hypothetical protein CY34DRAFT_199218 [Suillus luteus UH-Slu-Lm8-n1]|uniref:WD40 repeat-like protein n=1 Tax=Suillus luteus UH-Slu-Lm8-n1 TaxID=930992 RepID=A0A0D0AIB7_9AGAM|nr:hypothetical protein CY34DRAFT_199218 [Suillus luteus UH-Slu-Lm8-n1]
MPAIAPYRIIRSQSGFVEGVVHLPGGQHIITCSYNGSPKLWDLESSTQIGDDWRDEGTNVGLKTIALSPKGDMIAGGSIDGTVRLWSIETGKVVRRWTGHTEAVKSLCWSPDGERVVSGPGAIDKTIKVWNVRSATPVLDLKTGQSVHAVSYSPKATKIATAGSNIQIWDIKTGKLLWTIVCSSASTLDDKAILKFKNMEVACDLGLTSDTPKYIDVACSLAWTSDEEKLIAGDMRGSIRIFDTATWRQIALLDGHRGPVHAITLSRNDRLLVSASGDQKARLWNLDTNFLVGPALQHEHFVTSAAFSADGTLLSTGCADENAYVWNIYTILQATGLEDLLPVISLSDAPKSELKQDEC